MVLSRFDQFAFAVLLAASFVLVGLAWLHDHPEHDPRAPLTLAEPDGWATGRKFAALRSSRAVCRAFLDSAGVNAPALPGAGNGACLRDDRQVLGAPARLGTLLRPQGGQATCAVDAGLARWIRHGVQPAAEAVFRQKVVRIEHLGTASCRRIGGGERGNWSEHATGNAIDIASFVLADGSRISVAKDWTGKDAATSRFLHDVRDAACRSFSTVLSPDYNAAHADHLHLDQAKRAGGWSTCR
ncbi:extensin family protein [Novosphingobium resinovorum]|uniref:extensin-like domain-containing protein n=1 Tax=Novosphingobium TaxID=165696 RepID=UPI001B3C627D|nr:MULTISPECIES: extensin family protein [Novosphingobium]MBF7011660.1 extensin family protein [Novosphingobium sp. HR1a]WJM26414.1 extensin family protein [Novosphingobium resinovorum]